MKRRRRAFGPVGIIAGASQLTNVWSLDISGYPESKGRFLRKTRFVSCSGWNAGIKALIAFLVIRKT